MAQSPTPPLRSVDRLVRLVCLFFAASSFPLAAFQLVCPDVFWASLGLGGSPFVASLYAGAIAGEGVMFALGARDPRRYAVFFEYMTVYKAIAAIAATRLVVSGAAPLLGGAGVIAGWTIAGAISALVVARSRRAEPDDHA